MARGWLLSVLLALERTIAVFHQAPKRHSSTAGMTKGAGKARTPWLPALDMEMLKILGKAWGFSLWGW